VENDLAETIVRALRPAGEREVRDREARIVGEALELYSPADLSELFMAVRARAARHGEGAPLIDALRRAADREPHLSLAELAARASA